MWHSHLNDMEIPETKRFIPKGFELGTTLSYPIRSIVQVMFNANFYPKRMNNFVCQCND